MADQKTEDVADRTEKHLARAVAALDAQFGEGYAAKNPTVVAAFLQSASIEDAVSAGKAIAAMADGTANRSVERVCASIEYLKPRLFG